MKIFGIGLSKTGTSSLAHALELLNYNVKDCLGVSKYSKGNIASIDKNALLNHNALTDTPIPSFYQELDKEYPASKFILTIRDMDGWLKSCKKQFNQKSADKQSVAQNELFLDLYGTTVFDEDKFRSSYISFKDEVMAYFKNRPDDLLIINITSGEGWEKLCPFLDNPIPKTPFPKSNVTQIRWLNIHELAQKTRSAALQLHEQSKNLTTHKSTSTNKFKNLFNQCIGLDAANIINKTTQKTESKIIKELLSLDPNIPVITKTNHNSPLETRASWNHFWLVSCSEGQTQLENSAVGYSINIALIEDGLPFLGVIYIPELDTLYYAALDKGAFKAFGKSDPTKVEYQKRENTEHSSEENLAVNISATQSIGSTLCQTVETNTPAHLVIESSKEWQTAAGHAFLKTLGLTLLDDTSNTELKYNKEDWLNKRSTINT